ncbi:hypothetical protein [Komagataeibacter saccharivorans]|uniref:hypothetical protein n=1 Tax=Komagataeibacter saccharivorans TaxID=265959 RepID=UPI0039ED7E58
MTDRPKTFEIRISEDGEPDPALGASGPAYRLWKAKTAFAQAEKTLASQAETLSAYETRATSLLGWLSAELLAIVGTVATHVSHGTLDMTWALGSIGFLIPAIISTSNLSIIYRYKAWTVVGSDLDWLMKGWQGATEARALEELIQEYMAGMEENAQILGISQEALKRGWEWFILTPIIGLLTAIVVISLSQMK